MMSKTIIRYRLPERFYKPGITKAYTASSTVASFSPAQAERGSQGLRGSLVPGPKDKANDNRYPLLFTDAAYLKSGVVETGHNRCDYIQVITHLLYQKFTVYAIIDNQVTRLTSDLLTRAVDQIADSQIIEKFINEKQLARSEFEIIDHETIEELAEIIIGKPNTSHRETRASIDQSDEELKLTAGRISVRDFLEGLRLNNNLKSIVCESVEVFMEPDDDQYVSYISDHASELNLENIINLHLSNSIIPAKIIECLLSVMPNLEVLNLRLNRVSQKKLIETLGCERAIDLKKLTSNNLVALDLEGRTVNPESLMHVTNENINLRSLSLANSSFSEHPPENFASSLFVYLINIEHLDISEVELHGDWLGSFIENAQRLKSLILNRTVLEGGFENQFQHNIIKLQMISTVIKQEDVDSLFNGGKRLADVAYTGTINISDECTAPITSVLTASHTDFKNLFLRFNTLHTISVFRGADFTEKQNIDLNKNTVVDGVHCYKQMPIINSAGTLVANSVLIFNKETKQLTFLREESTINGLFKTIEQRTSPGTANTGSDHSFDRPVYLNLDVNSEHKRPGVVYDGHSSNSGISTHLKSLAQGSRYQMKSYFELRSGPDLVFSQVRVRDFKPIFKLESNTIDKKPIYCDLEAYHPDSSSQSGESTYEQPEYETRFNGPRPELGLTRPWIRLYSLSFSDRLLTLNTSIPREHYDIFFSRSDRYFYLILKSGYQHKGQIKLNYLISPQKISDFHAHAPEDLKSLISPFKRLYTQPPPASFDKLSIAEKMREIQANPHQHDCDARSIALCQLLERSGQLEAIQCTQSHRHTWLILCYRGLWYFLDAGGAPATCDYSRVSETTSQKRWEIKSPFSKKHSPYQRIAQNSDSSQSTPPSETRQAVAPQNTGTVIDTVESLQALFNSGKSTNTPSLFICKDSKHVDAIRRYLLSLHAGSIFTVDTYEQASASQPFIAVNHPQKTWERVEPTQPAGYPANQLAKNPQYLLVNWNQIPNAVVKLNTTIDARNRNLDGLPLPDTLNIIGLVTEKDALDPAFLDRHGNNIYRVTVAPAPQSRTDALPSLSIELYQSERWLDLLIGHLRFTDTGEATQSPRPVMELNTGHHLIIHNPPKNSPRFNYVIDALKEGHPFQYYDQTLTLPKMQVSFEHGYPAQDTTHILSVHQNIYNKELSSIPVDHLITPSTFERLLYTQRVDNRCLKTSPGWLCTHKTELNLFITRTLSDGQYAMLRNAVHQHWKKTGQQLPKLRLLLAKGVDVPAAFREKIDKTFVPTEELSSEGSATIEGHPSPTQFPDNATVIDVSEFSSDDILYALDYTRTGKHFNFFETISPIWKKLEAGEHIVLKGYFSDELTDHLSSLLLPNQGYLWHDGQKKLFKGKLTLMPNRPLTRISWIKQNRANQPDVISLTIEPRIIEHESERKPVISEVLNQHHAAFIEGQPGSGKTHFINSLKNDPQVRCYFHNSFDVKPLKDFMSDSDTTTPIMYIIDDATSLGTSFTRFMNPNRELLVGDQLENLTPNKKILAFGSRVPNMPAFLKSIPNLVFMPLSPETILNDILTPIFSEIHDVAHAKQEAQLFYEANALLPLRTLHDKAIAHCAQIKHLNPVLNNPENYYLTPSRKPIFQSIVDLIRSHDFKCQAQSEPAQHGGQTGLLLEGSPGIGKSEIVDAAFQAMGFQKRMITDLNQARHDRAYYYVPPNCHIPTLRKLLRKAFEHNVFVMIDEIDALLMGETPEMQEEISRLITEMNAYMMGDDLAFSDNVDGKIRGIHFAFTGNGKHYKHRAILPASLLSRLQVEQVKPYNEAECWMVIRHYHPHLSTNDVYVRALVDQYVKDSKTHGFRRLLNMVKTYAANLPEPAAEKNPFAPEKPVYVWPTQRPMLTHYKSRVSASVLLGCTVGGIIYGCLHTLTHVHHIPVALSIALAAALVTAIICMAAQEHQVRRLRPRAMALV